METANRKNFEKLEKRIARVSKERGPLKYSFIITYRPEKILYKYWYEVKGSYMVSFKNFGKAISEESAKRKARAEIARMIKRDEAEKAEVSRTYSY